MYQQSIEYFDKDEKKNLAREFLVPEKENLLRGNGNGVHRIVDDVKSAAPNMTQNACFIYI